MTVNPLLNSIVVPTTGMHTPTSTRTTIAVREPVYTPLLLPVLLDRGLSRLPALSIYSTSTAREAGSRKGCSWVWHRGGCSRVCGLGRTRCWA
eukprot:330445-Pelagomonas_calceolata.AAC.1